MTGNVVNSCSAPERCLKRSRGTSRAARVGRRAGFVAAHRFRPTEANPIKGEKGAGGRRAADGGGKERNVLSHRM